MGTKETKRYFDSGCGLLLNFFPTNQSWAILIDIFLGIAELTYSWVGTPTMGECKGILKYNCCHSEGGKQQLQFTKLIDLSLPNNALSIQLVLIPSYTTVFPNTSGVWPCLYGRLVPKLFCSVVNMCRVLLILQGPPRQQPLHKG